MSEQPFNVNSLLRQAVKLASLRVMLKKVYRRLWDDRGHHSSVENLQWIQAHCSDFKTFAQVHQAELWQEAEAVAAEIALQASKKLQPIPYKLGGGGVYPLLYFIARYRRPACIVETGVAAGYSSYAFLEAIRRNGQGRLYSSDFPYFRLPNPEQYIGMIVPDSLKAHWQLYLAGDEVNLPIIAAQISAIDIFHYDSDKSYAGRQRALTWARPLLQPSSLILMDDIQDNSHFYDFVEANPALAWHIFEFEGKYVGMVGELR